MQSPSQNGSERHRRRWTRVRKYMYVFSTSATITYSGCRATDKIKTKKWNWNGVGLVHVSWCFTVYIVANFFFFCSCYLSHRRSATTTPKPAVSLCALWLTVARCALKYRQSHSLWLLWSVQALGKRNTFPLSTTNRKFRMRGVSFLHVTLE